MECQLEGPGQVDGDAAAAAPGGRPGRGAEDSTPAPLRLRQTLLERLAARLLPARCLLCLDPGGADGLDLCTPCAADFPRLGAACERCARPLATGAGPQPPALGAGSGCAHCEREPPPFDAAWAAFRYDWPVDGLVQAHKYRGRLAAGRVLAEAFAREFAAVGRRRPLPHALVPVPLHPRRERGRGFNQSFELARVIGRRLGVPVQAGLVRRVRDTVAQAGLPAAGRAANLAGAFASGPPGPLRHVALVDDVMTTGSTLAALAAVLRDAGVEHVEAWAISRA